jgi:hypothetical protein
MPTVFSATSAGNLVTSGEGVVAITPPLNPGIDAPTVLVLFQWGTNSIGTAATQATLQIKRGAALPGAVFASGGLSVVTAAQAYIGFLMAMDTPGAVAGQQYIGTVTLANATANTSTNLAIMVAIAIG